MAISAKRPKVSRITGHLTRNTSNGWRSELGLWRIGRGRRRAGKVTLAGQMEKKNGQR